MGWLWSIVTLSILSPIFIHAADVQVEVRSEGCNDPGKHGTCGTAMIKVNGVDYSAQKRGHNFVVLDSSDGTVLKTDAFDTHGLISDNDRMKRFVDSLPAKCIVLVAVQDEGAGALRTSGKIALYAVGATSPYQLAYRGSFALVGHKGLGSPQWKKTVMKARYKGPSTISTTISVGVPPTQPPTTQAPPTQPPTTQTPPTQPPTTQAPPSPSTVPPPVKYLQVSVRSEGYEDPGKTGTNGRAFIKVNNVDYSAAKRGYNFVVVDYNTGSITKTDAFDILGNPGDNNRMLGFVNSISSPSIVLVAIQDEASSRITSIGKQALLKVGASSNHPKNYRGSYALIGHIGLGSPSWKAEKVNVRKKGPSTLQAMIPYAGSPPPPVPTTSGPQPPVPTTQGPQPPVPTTQAPQPGQCGTGGPASYIVGGVEATPNSWPWMVSLSRYYSSGSHGHFCGGSLVTKYHVVTAAHCVSTTGNYQVRLGDHYLYDNTGKEQTIRVVKVWKHEQYGKSGGHDVAVLKLKTPAQINNAVSLVCLDKQQNFPAGKECVVTGWGTTSSGGSSSKKLLQVKVPLRSDAECKQSYPGQIGTTEICAGYPEGQKDSCQGDSGGPLVCKNNQSGRWHLTGIVSWGYKCAAPGKYGVYGKVSALQDWIQDKLNQ